MNKKILWIIAGIVFLIGAGVYFTLSQQRSSRLQTVANFEECAQANYLILESYPAKCLTPDGRMFVQEIKSPPASGLITVSGEMTCLPKVRREAQTMECAVGLKGKDGRYYGLKNLSKFDPEYKFSVGGLRVEVSGIFGPEEIIGPNSDRYDVVGVIDVTSIKEVQN